MNFFQLIRRAMQENGVDCEPSTRQALLELLSYFNEEEETRENEAGTLGMAPEENIPWKSQGLAEELAKEVAGGKCYQCSFPI